MLRARCRGGSSGSPAGRPLVSPGGTDAQLSPRISLAGATPTWGGNDQEACPSPGPPPGTTIGTPLDLIDCTATGGSAPSPRSRDCRAWRAKSGRARCGGERACRRGAPRFSPSHWPPPWPHRFDVPFTQAAGPSLQSRVHGVYGKWWGSGRVGRAPGALLPPMNRKAAQRVKPCELSERKWLETSLALRSQTSSELPRAARATGDGRCPRQAI